MKSRNISNAAMIAVATFATWGGMTVTATDAHAITCRGIVQINKNTRIVTPYCEAEYLASVARTYGVKTSGKRLRNNVNHKQTVCEFIGHDNRVSSVCGGFRREDRGGRYSG